MTEELWAIGGVVAGILVTGGTNVLVERAKIRQGSTETKRAANRERCEKSSLISKRRSRPPGATSSSTASCPATPAMKKRQRKHAHDLQSLSCIAQASCMRQPGTS